MSSTSSGVVSVGACSFLAICAGRWVAGVSLAPAHLRTLGQTLVGFFERSRWQCEDVVNLAGDRQAVLLLATGDQTVIYHGDPKTYEASLLGFRSRPAAPADP